MEPSWEEPASIASTPTPAIQAAPSSNHELLPPEGYVSTHVFRVVSTPHGSAVLLRSDDRERVLPIFVGGTEALSIDLRHEAKRFQRPLTHDLLDNLVDKLGGTPIKVHVDSLRSNTFVGRVYMKQGERVFDVDARPSDAIAIALGNRIPIFVASQVLDAAGVRVDDFAMEDDGLPTTTTGRPSDPMQL